MENISNIIEKYQSDISKDTHNIPVVHKVVIGTRKKDDDLKAPKFGSANPRPTNTVIIKIDETIIENSKPNEETLSEND